MKNLTALLLLSGLAFTACKKDRVCSCTTTTTGTTSAHTVSQLLGTDTTIVTPLNTTNSNDVKFFKVTKKVAASNCFNKSESVNEVSTSGITGFLSITTTNTGTRDYNCKLK